MDKKQLTHELMVTDMNEQNTFDRRRRQNELRALLRQEDMIDINTQGGRQSNIARDFDTYPEVMLEVARVLYNGRIKYGSGNERRIPTTDHVNHALNHLYLWLSGDNTEDHLTHAICRCIFAKSLSITPTKLEI